MKGREILGYPPNEGKSEYERSIINIGGGGGGGRYILGTLSKKRREGKKMG